MHINWWIVGGVAYGAFQIFVSYLPAPGKIAGAPSAWWYVPVFHVSQYLAFNPGRSSGVLKAQAPDQK